MSENLRNYTVAVFGLEHVIRCVAPDAWDSPSPCEGWSAREVAGHAMGVVNNVAAKAGVGEALDIFGDVRPIAGDDPAAAFRTIRNRYLRAVDRPGTLRQLVRSSLGDMILDDYLFEMTGDAVVHTWDIARATGVDETLDADLVEMCHDTLVERDSPALRSPGRYGDAVEVTIDMSAQDRMIAYAGRDPRR